MEFGLNNTPVCHMPRGAGEGKGYMKDLNDINEGETMNGPSMIAAWHRCHVFESSKAPFSKVSITGEGAENCLSRLKWQRKAKTQNKGTVHTEYTMGVMLPFTALMQLSKSNKCQGGHKHLKSQQVHLTLL